MFSPIGKKKILLQIKRAKEMGVENPLEVVQARMEKTSPNGSPNKRPGSAGSVRDTSNMKSANMTTNKISQLVEDTKSDKGQLMKKLLESTVRYVE